MSDMAVEIPADALRGLALPPLETLSNARVRGADCAWCGDQLTAETAIGLGERLTPLEGTTSPMRWFPRACRHCTQAAALRALHNHAPRCTACQHDYKTCSTRHGLTRLLRECR